MKRFLFLFSMVLVLLIPQLSWATTTSQYPNPYRQTMWNNFTDNVHTLGQTPQQAKATKQRLHIARNKARLHSIYVANVAKRRAWANSQ
jgi:hypothetical protein